MKRLVTFVACIAVLTFAGCVTEKKTAGRDGASLESAVMIDVKRQVDSPAAEWAWIEKHLPGAKRPIAKPPSTASDGEEIVSFAHSLITKNGRTYSSLLVELPDGIERTVYFDITSCFGR